MKIADILKTLFAQQLIPGRLRDQRFNIPQSKILLNDNQPVFARISLGDGGFVDLALPQEGEEITLAAIGTGRGEIHALPSIYPKLFDGVISAKPSQDPLYIDLIPQEIRDWDRQSVDNVIVNADVADGKIHWLDDRVTLDEIRSQYENWCVPTAMAKLSSLVYGQQRTPEYFAALWGQKKNELFVESRWFDDDVRLLTTCYERLRGECLAGNMIESLTSWNQLRCVSTDWLQKLGHATLFVEQEHADVVHAANSIYDGTAKTIHGYATVTPRDHGTAWIANLPKNDLQLRFAFTVT